MAPNLLRSHEAAQYLGVSYRTICRMRTRTDGPPWLKLGSGQSSRVQYDTADLDIWLASRKRTGEARP